VADVQNYLERGGSQVTDPTVYNQIPRLINAAERKIIQFLKLQGQIEPLTDPAGLPAGVSVIAKPDRWRSTISLNYGGGQNLNQRTFLLPRSYEFCRYYWPDDTVMAPPVFYADYDLRHWLIVGTPDQTYPLEVLAYMQPPLLDQNNQTNFFTDYTPNMLLYGALLEASPFLKADERIQTWQGFWDREASSLSGQDLQKILDRTAQRTNP
jgi:hypothetical protein